MFSLQGKIAIVTGASQGIGEAIAKVLALQGAQVIAVARNEVKLKQTVTMIQHEGGLAEYLVGDISQTEEDKTNRGRRDSKTWCRSLPHQ